MKRIISILMASYAILIIGGCAGNHGKESHEHEHEHEEEAAHEHDGCIEISPERQEALGIAVDTVSTGEFNEIIHTSGQIVSSNGYEMTIVAKSEGIVSLRGLS